MKISWKFFPHWTNWSNYHRLCNQLFDLQHLQADQTKNYATSTKIFPKDHKSYFISHPLHHVHNIWQIFDLLGDQIIIRIKMSSLQTVKLLQLWAFPPYSYLWLANESKMDWKFTLFSPAALSYLIKKRGIWGQQNSIRIGLLEISSERKKSSGGITSVLSDDGELAYNIFVLLISTNFALQLIENWLNWKL